MSIHMGNVIKKPVKSEFINVQTTKENKLGMGSLF